MDFLSDKDTEYYKHHIPQDSDIIFPKLKERKDIVFDKKDSNIYPYTAIGNIEINNLCIGSGALIWENIVITNAKLVYNIDNDTYAHIPSITFAIGTIHTTIEEIHVAEKYKKGDNSFSYAILILSRPFEKNGHIQIGPIPYDINNKNHMAYITFCREKTVYSVSSPIKLENSLLKYYELKSKDDCIIGAPILISDSYTNEVYLVGIHSDIKNKSVKEYCSYGVPISRNTSELLNEWIEKMFNKSKKKFDERLLKVKIYGKNLKKTLLKKVTYGVASLFDLIKDLKNKKEIDFDLYNVYVYDKDHSLIMESLYEKIKIDNLLNSSNEIILFIKKITEDIITDKKTEINFQLEIFGKRNEPLLKLNPTSNPNSIDKTKSLNQTTNYYFYEKEAHLNIGLKYLSQENFEEALSSFNNSLTIDSNYKDAYLNLGVYYRTLKDYETAKKCLTKAIEIYPRYKEAYNEMGTINKLTERYQEALNTILFAIKIDPHYKEALYNLGDVYKKQGDYEKAIACFNNILSGDSGDKDAHFFLGIVLYTTGKYDLALKSFLKVVELDSRHKKAYYNIGNIYNKQLKYDKAISNFLQSIAIDSKYKKSHFNLGTAYFKQNIFDKAAECYAKVIEIDPNDKEAYVDLGNCLYKIKKYEEAKKYFIMAIEIDNNFKKPYYYLGMCYYKLKLFDKGIIAFKKAIELDPNQKKYYYNLGILYDEIGEIDNAVKCLKKAVDFDNFYEDAKKRLESCLRKQNNKNNQFDNY